MEPNKKEVRKPVSHDVQLSEAVKQAVKQGTIKLGELAGQLGISPAYLSSLLRGERPWAGIKAPRLRILASAIKRPPMWVFVRAGWVDIADFFEAPASVTAEATYEAMLAHPALSPYTPSQDEWESMSPQLRQTFVLMFEAALSNQRLHS